MENFPILLQATLDALSSHIAILDQEGIILSVNKRWRDFGRENDSCMENDGVGKNYLKVCEQAAKEGAKDAGEVAVGIRRLIEKEIREFSIEYPCHSPNEERWFILRATRFEDEAGVRIVLAHENVTEWKQVEHEWLLNENRLSSLLALSQQAHLLNEMEIVRQAIESAVELTKSEIGYLHFVNPDQRTIQLVTWSQRTLEFCTAVHESHYPLDRAGVWADCVRLGKPVIHNDYQNLPGKKGYPTGHSHLIRHASIPIFHDGKIRLILGVGNKLSDYDSTDILQMELVGEQLVMILERKHYEEALLIKDKAIASSLSAIALADLKGNLSYVNQSFMSMWGYDELADVLGRSATDFWSSEGDALQVMSALENTGNWIGELTAKRKDGSQFEVQLAANRVTGEGGKPICLFASFIDVTERRQAENSLNEVNTLLIEYLEAIDILQKELREQAIRDYLTGLFNRRYLEATLEREISRAGRELRQLSVVFMDIDNFKKINDTFGHQAGDIVLKELGVLLASNSRASDVACRQGGDEFVVVLPGASNADAIKRAEEWRGAFAAKTFIFQDNSYSTTLSLGVATFPVNANSANGVLQAADEALYRSKQHHNAVMPSLRSSTLTRKTVGQ